MKIAERVRNYSNQRTRDEAADAIDAAEKALDNLYNAYGRKGFDEAVYSEARAALAKLRGVT